MATKIHIKESKRGTFTAAAKKRGKSVQGFASQVMANKGNYSPAMVKKANFARNFGGNKEYGGSLDELYDMYSFGGWLKSNAGNILQTVAGGAMMATGIGAPIGASLMTSGAAGMLGSVGQGNEENTDEISEVYKPPVSKARQTYDIPMANGGNLRALSQRTDYKGASHEAGGIKLPGMGVEVEGEESRTGDMIHSDKIKIDKNIYNTYKDMVPLSKSDIGKSVAQVLKRKDKRFERRSGDLWNDQARIASQKPFEMMSDELSDMHNQESYPMMAYGGDLINEGNPTEIPEVAVYGKRKIPPTISSVRKEPLPTYTPSGAGNWTYYPEQDKWVSRTLRTDKDTPLTISPDAFEKRYNNILLRPGYRNKKYGGMIKAQDGLNLNDGGGGFNFGNVKDFLNDPGNAPIIGSGISALTNILRRPEKVSYEQAKFTPTQFTPMDASGGINRIRRSYGDARARMKRINPRGYMNTLTSMGASEAETIGDYSAGVGNVNAQMRNRAYSQDAESRNRLAGFNTEVAIREAEANAANRGMRRTAIDASMNNMFTQMGQKSRDDKLYQQQDKYIDMMGTTTQGWRDMMFPPAKESPEFVPYDESEIYDMPSDESLYHRTRYGGRIRKLNTLRFKR